MTAMSWIRPIAAFVGVVAVASLALNGCADTTPSARLQGGWVLIDGRDAQGAFIATPNPITLAIDGDRFGGEGPCNLYGGTITVGGGGAVGFETLTSTQRACIDTTFMTLEDRYYAALDAVTTAAVDDELTLSGDGVALRYARDDG